MPPDTSASEVTTLWRYTNLFIIIIIIIIIIFSPPAQSRRQENCRLDVQNYGCNGNLLLTVTLLSWCCGKKPHFLFAEPWKGVGKGMLSAGYHL